MHLRTLCVHWWSSGRIVPCHGTDPGSIPGQCMNQNMCISLCADMSFPDIGFEAFLPIERPHIVDYVSAWYFLVESNREGAG